MGEASVGPSTYVTFSDTPIKLHTRMAMLSGNTDEQTNLKDLLILMYRTWTATGFQDGLRKETPLIVLP